MKAFAFVLGGLALLAAGSEVRSAAAPANLRDLMKDTVAVQTQVIWDIGNRAQDDQGNPDPAKLAGEDWSRIGEAAGKLREVAQALSQSQHVLVAPAGEKIDGEGNEGALGAKQVQAAIDANPAEFRARSQALAASMDQIVTAAKARDARTLFDVSGALDQVCEDCHVRFWYPPQGR